jgi:sec-independent protein translocase protein TatC
VKKLTNNNKPIISHFQDIKTLVLHLVLIVSFSFLIGYFCLEWFIEYVKNNILHESKVHFFHPLEPITFAVKSSFLIGLILSMPLILLRVGIYFLPIVKLKKTFITQTLLDIVLFDLGVSIALKFVCPSVFLLAGSYFSENIPTMLNITSTFGMIFLLCFIFGFLLQFPLIIWALILNQIVEIETLQKFRKFHICGSFILAGILTPPDVFSQIAVAVLLILSFEITIFILSKCKGLKRK